MLLAPLYDESTGRVTIRLKHGKRKVFQHACDFLAALAQHVPKARLQTVTYAGYYANATGNLSSKKDDEQPDPSVSEVRVKRYIPWSELILKSWSVDPELCPLCGERMERKKPISEKTELETLLKRLNQWGYPPRPPPAPLPSMTLESGSSQVPPEWGQSAAENLE